MAVRRSLVPPLAVLLTLSVGCAADGGDSVARISPPSATTSQAPGIDPYESTLSQAFAFQTFKDWGTADLVATLVVTDMAKVPPRTVEPARNNAAFRLVTADVGRVIAGSSEVKQVRFYQLDDEVVDGVALKRAIPGSIRLQPGDKVLAAIVSGGGDFLDPNVTALHTVSSLFLHDGKTVQRSERRARNGDSAPGSRSNSVIDEAEGRSLEEVIQMYQEAVRRG